MIVYFLFWELLIEWMSVSVYYKRQTILLDNIAAIIFQKTINLFYQRRGKCLQLPQTSKCDESDILSYFLKIRPKLVLRRAISNSFIRDLSWEFR